MPNRYFAIIESALALHLEVLNLVPICGQLALSTDGRTILTKAAILSIWTMESPRVCSQRELKPTTMMTLLTLEGQRSTICRLGPVISILKI